MSDQINDCQGERDYATFYRALSPFEKKLFRAIGIAFQLKDFGHNVNDETDGECFEQDVEQMNRFEEANRAALAAAMEIVSPELSRLRSELEEAREIIRTLADMEPSSLVEPGSDDDRYTLYLSEKRQAHDVHGDQIRRARAFLTKGETDA